MAKNASEKNLYRSVSINPQTGKKLYAETQQRWEAVTAMKNVKKLGWEAYVERRNESGQWVYDEQGNAEEKKEAPRSLANPEVIIKSTNFSTFTKRLAIEARKGLSKAQAVEFIQNAIDLALAMDITPDEISTIVDQVSNSDEEEE